MGTVEVKLLNFKFRFHDMRWRKEFGIKYEANKDRLRTILSHALEEVSGLPINSTEQAMRIFEALPSAIVYRIFLIYKGSLPEPRLFKTVGLYQAPEPNRFVKKIQEAEQEREHIMDRVEQEMEAKFGKQELREAREQELQMLRNSKGRGITRATDDDDRGLGTRPPINPSARIKTSEPENL